ADVGVVDALHALAGRGVAPAVIGGDATADVLLAALLRLVRPLRIGEQLSRQTDGVAVAGLQQFLGVSRPGDAADQQHGLGRYAADVAGIAALPAALEMHGRVDEGVMDARGHADIVDVDLTLERRDDLLDLVDLEIAGPKRRRVDAIAEERLRSDRPPDGADRLNREAQAILERAAPAIGAFVVERR